MRIEEKIFPPPNAETFSPSDHILEKAMATHSSTLAWKIPWTEEPGRLQSMGHEESDTTERLHFHFPLGRIAFIYMFPLEKEMASHSSFLAWRIPWTEEPGRLQSMGSQESDTT